MFHKTLFKIKYMILHDKVLSSLSLTSCIFGEGESEVAQSCPTLCDPMDYSPPGFSSMEFSRQECWSRLPFPSPGDLPDPGIEPRSPALQTDALASEPSGKSSCYTQCQQPF